MSGPAPPELHDVVIEIDPEVLIESEEHQAGLIREFRLITIGHLSPEDESRVPRRLADLIVEILADYQGVQEQNLQAARAAVERGDRVVRLEMRLPAEVVPAIEKIRDALEEADEYCRSGEGLLTTPASPAVRDARRWFVDEVRRQVTGG